MKVRLAGMAVLVLGLGTMILAGPPVSGQTAAVRELADTPPGATAGPYSPNAYTQVPPGYYAINNIYRFAGHDPEMQKILSQEAQSEREAAKLIKDYARTDNEGQRDKIKTKLSDALGKEFDLQQKRRDLELARLEAQVKKLRDLMKKRNDARQTIVDKRLDQLIREAEGLGWTTPPGAALPKLDTPAVAPLRE